MELVVLSTWEDCFSNSPGARYNGDGGHEAEVWWAMVPEAVTLFEEGELDEEPYLQDYTQPEHSFELRQKLSELGWYVLITQKPPVDGKSECWAELSRKKDGNWIEHIEEGATCEEALVNAALSAYPEPPKEDA